MEMTEHLMNGSRREYSPMPAQGRVHHARRGRGVIPGRGERGFTLIEVVMTMMLLSLGLMSLGPLMLSVVRGNRFAQDVSLATALAEDRLEQVLHYTQYDSITPVRFLSEAQGQVHNGDPEYIKFARAVTIVESLDVLGMSLMKNVTVVITWRGITSNEHSVTMYGRVARF